MINSGNGGGGRDYEELKIKNYELDLFKKEVIYKQEEERAIKRINKIIKSDPIISKLKKSYLKIKADKEGRIKKSDLNKERNSMNRDETVRTDRNKNYDINGNNYSDEVSRSQKKRESDLVKEVKAKRNLIELKNLSKDEQNKRMVEDMLLTTNINRNGFEITDNINTPSEFKLSQNYPNPFNPETNISFGIPKESFVKIKIYDITGREIKVLVNELKQAGSYKVIFNGSGFSSGVYFYKLEAGEFLQVRRMVMLK